MDPDPIFTIDTSSTVTCLLVANHYLPHHTFNPLLQQIGELDNLTDSLGQSLEFVLCRSPCCLQHLCDIMSHRCCKQHGDLHNTNSRLCPNESVRLSSSPICCNKGLNVWCGR